MKNCKIIAISNQKGGVGKTTTVIQAVSYISDTLNKKVLMIDMDPQGNAGNSLDCSKQSPGLYDLLVNEVDTRIHKQPFLDVITCNNAKNIEIALYNRPGKELILSDILNDVRHEYEYIFIDCPPEFSILTDMAYVASDKIVVPIHADEYSIQGVKELHDRMLCLKRLFNQNLRISGLLMVDVNRRTNAYKDTLTNDIPVCCEALQTKLYQSSISTSVDVDEAQKRHLSLMQYKPQGKVTLEYINFLEELCDEETRK